jgi:hypothetical protein
MTSNSYPALAQFLGAYFHQDFMLDYSSPDATIAAFIADEPAESIHAVCNELEQVIPVVDRMHDPEEFLWRVLGCYYVPKTDELTVSEWLKHVYGKLRA